MVVLLLLFGGGGFYFGGPVIGGSGLGLILLICLVIYLAGRIPHEKPIGWRDARLRFISARHAGLLLHINGGVCRNRD